MGPAKSRKPGKGKGHPSNQRQWTEEDFRNPPDQSEQSTWTVARRNKFQELRNEWLAGNSGSPEGTATNVDDNKLQDADADDQNVATESSQATGSAPDTPSDIVSSVANLNITESSQMTNVAAQSTTTTIASSTSSNVANTITTFYTIESLTSNPSPAARPDEKIIDGDLEPSEVDAYVLKSQRSIAGVGNLDSRKVTRFSANHLALQVDRGTEIVHIYPVTIIHEQRPQSMRNAPQRLARGQDDSNPQGYPDVPARKKRRIFELLLLALQTAVPYANNRRATNYKTQIATVQHELSVPTKTQIVRAPFLVNIRYYDSSQTTPSNDPWIYQIAISTARRLEVGRLQRTLNGNMQPNEVAFTAQEIHGMKAEYLDLFNMMTTQIPMEKCIRTTENMSNGMALAGTSKLYPYDTTPRGLSDTVNMHNGLSALFGFYRSARLLNSLPRLQLNINTSTSAFYRWENLHTVMSDKIVGDFQGGEGVMNLGSVTIPQWQELERFVRGVQVRAQYNTVNSIYTITGLAMTEPEIVWDQTRQKKVLQDRVWPWDGHTPPVARNVNFFMDQRDAQGQRVVDARGIVQKQQPPIQLVDYYNNTLRVPLRGDQFVVRTGGGEHVLYFPANLLTVLPGQHYKGQIAITAGAKPPIVNRREILATGKAAYSFDPASAPAIATRFGLSLGGQGNLLQVAGERLGFRSLQYKSSTVSETPRWNLRDAKCLAPPTTRQADRWSVLEFTRGQPSHNGNTRNFNNERLGQFVASFSSALTKFGIGLQSEVDSTDRYHGHKINIDSPDPWGALRYNMVTYPHVKLWVILLPDRKTEWYSQIKIIGDLEFGVSTVCHVKKNFKGENDCLQLCSNICLKANLKLSRSSVNHALSKPSTLLNSETMVVGIDVTHAPGGARKNSPSVAAVVASTDTRFAQWPASIKLNARDELDTKEALEEVQALKLMMIERLTCYKRYNNRYPKRIIIYRDGLSDGQFQMAKTREFGRVMAAIDQLYDPGNHPEIMLLCAVKRHHTRFYPTSNNPTGSTSGPNASYQGDHNPAVSTAFYDTVTYGEGKDFFLVSQNAMRGVTVRPTHYVVLVNTCANVSIRDVANMTLDLCFLFGRATVSVGLATPAYYADLACGRAAKYLAPHTRPDPRRPHLPFDYATVPNIQLAPVDDPNKPGENFGDSMFYL